MNLKKKKVFVIFEIKKEKKMNRLDSGYIKVTTSTSLTGLAVTLNATKGKIWYTTLTHGATSALNAVNYITLTNNRIGPESFVLVSFPIANGLTTSGALPSTWKIDVAANGGSAIIGITNFSTTAIAALEMDFLIVNPIIPHDQRI